MAIPQNPAKCDRIGCGAERGETNHWFAVLKCDNGGVLILPWAIAERDFDLKALSHFCGQSHALQFASEAIGDQGAPKP